MRYLTKTLWEKNADNGLEIHEDLDAAASAIQIDRNSGATSIQLFELVELEFEIETVTRLRVEKKETEND